MDGVVEDFGETAEELYAETGGDVVFRRESPGIVEDFVLNEWYFGSLIECIVPIGPEWTGLALQYHAHSLGPDSPPWSPSSVRELVDELGRVDRKELLTREGYGAHVEQVLNRLLAFLEDADSRGMRVVVGGRSRL